MRCTYLGIATYLLLSAWLSKPGHSQSAMVEQIIFNALGADQARTQFVLSAVELSDSSNRQFRQLGFPYACDGFVLASLKLAGYRVDPILRQGAGVEGIYNFVKENGRLFHRETPKVGDLVFFRRTYDKRSTLSRLGLTHVAIVEDRLSDGTLVIIHKVNSGVRRGRLNLGYAKQHRHPVSGEVVNSYLKRRPRRDQNRSRYLTSAFFYSFAEIL